MKQLIDWGIIERESMTPFGFKMPIAILLDQVWREHLDRHPDLEKKLVEMSQPEVNEWRMTFSMAVLAGIQLVESHI